MHNKKSYKMEAVLNISNGVIPQEADFFNLIYPEKSEGISTKKKSISFLMTLVEKLNSSTLSKVKEFDATLLSTIELLVEGKAEPNGDVVAGQKAIKASAKIIHEFIYTINAKFIVDDPITMQIIDILKGSLDKLEIIVEILYLTEQVQLAQSQYLDGKVISLDDLAVKYAH